MKREIRNKRDEMRKQWGYLRSAAIWQDNWEKAKDIRKEEEEIYKKWQFYDNFIKKMEEKL